MFLVSFLVALGGTYNAHVSSRYILAHNYADQAIILGGQSNNYVVPTKYKFLRLVEIDAILLCKHANPPVRLRVRMPKSSEG